MGKASLTRESALGFVGAVGVAWLGIQIHALPLHAILRILAALAALMLIIRRLSPAFYGDERAAVELCPPAIGLALLALVLGLTVFFPVAWWGALVLAAVLYGRLRGVSGERIVPAVLVAALAVPWELGPLEALESWIQEGTAWLGMTLVQASGGETYLLGSATLAGPLAPVRVDTACASLHLLVSVTLFAVILGALGDLPPVRVVGLGGMALTLAWGSNAVRVAASWHAAQRYAYTPTWSTVHDALGYATFGVLYLSIVAMVLRGRVDLVSASVDGKRPAPKAPITEHSPPAP